MQDTSLRCIEDWEFVVRFAKYYLIGFVDEELVDVYLERGGGVSSNPEEYLRVRFKILHDHRAVLGQNGLLEQQLAELFLNARRAGLLDRARQYYTDTFFG